MWDIVWVSPQGHTSVSVSRHFLLQASQCPCSVQKRFSRDHCCRGRSKPGCRIVLNFAQWEWFTIGTRTAVVSMVAVISSNSYDTPNSDGSRNFIRGYSPFPSFSPPLPFCPLPSSASPTPFIPVLLPFPNTTRRSERALWAPPAGLGRARPPNAIWCILEYSVRSGLFRSTLMPTDYRCYRSTFYSEVTLGKYPCGVENLTHWQHKKCHRQP